uniref:Uncharacterized protein n=1 Tax=Tetraselmis chuii TaxID=63592 RepID=A0A7S1SXC3_9CHLO
MFTEDTLPKTVATCLKAPKALDQFYKALRPNDSERHTEYPFMSACGPWETNFVKAAASPIVFVDLVEHDDQLLYGGTLRTPFDPAHLRLCPDSGRLFHRLLTPNIDFLGLLRSQLAERVAQGIELVEEGGPAWQDGRLGHFSWKGSQHELLSIHRPFVGSASHGESR